MNVLCIGAHPDDCEASVGGTALLMRARGDRVLFMSATEGSRGHFEPAYLRDPSQLIQRRKKESLEAARRADVEFESLDLVDGEVYVDRASTEATIRLIRRFSPDLVLLNRPCDYHRDHRNTAQLVIDASYMLTVPFLCPDVPPMDKMPTFAYWQDRFTESGAFRADVAIPIDSVIHRKVEIMLAHESQFLEWLPYNAHPAAYSGPISEELAKPALAHRSRGTAHKFAQLLPEGTEFAEAFQICEYGDVPAADELRKLFPV